jgi:hypothetical protein
MFKHVSTTMILIAAASACRGNDTTPIDSHASTDGTNVDAPGSNPCNNNYTMSSIAAMRQSAPGCIELDNVVALAVTPSTSSPYLYVQDAAGGDFSAVETHCVANSTSHPCTVASQVAGIPVGHSVTIKGTYIRSGSTHFEEFYIDAITDNGAGTLPAPGAPTLAQIERSSTAYKLAFQRVSLSIAAADQLKMYDWSPTEFVRTATACPYVFGFGMIPKSTSGATATGACTSGTAQPAGQTSPNAAEVLFDTRFFTNFKVSSDCRCAKTYSDMEPSATSTLTGTVQGILIFNVPFMATTGYMSLAPTSMTDAPITNTVAGM